MDRPECNVGRLRELQAEYYGDEDLRRALQWSASEIEKLRALLEDARDDVAECVGRETKPRRVEAYKSQLAAIDKALLNGPT